MLLRELQKNKSFKLKKKVEKEKKKNELSVKCVQNIKHKQNITKTRIETKYDTENIQTNNNYYLPKFLVGHFSLSHLFG